MTKKPLSIGELLAKEPGRLKSLQAGAKQAESTLDALKSLLAGDLSEALEGATVRDDGRKLEVLVGSTPSATRVRFALGEIHHLIQERLGLSESMRIHVRVKSQLKAGAR